MSLVLHYCAGAAFQLIGMLGLSALALQLGAKAGWNKKPLVVVSGFALAQMAESLLLTVLSFCAALPAGLLLVWFWFKLALGLLAILRHRADLYVWICKHRLLTLWGAALLLNASLPTSSYDCFTAHFSIARLFVEAGGYPLRPDYQYMDFLPLAAHMWFLPGLAAGCEGALNIIAPAFAWMLWPLIEARWGRRCAFWSWLVLLSMPEFIRLSLDPMMDTPSIFYALLGLACLDLRMSKHPAAWPQQLALAGVSWSFLLGIKQTLAIFPIAWAGLCLWQWHKKNIQGKHLAGFALLALFCGGLWYGKNGYLHNNVFYPYLGAAAAFPDIPAAYRPLGFHLNLRALCGYLRIIFLDHHWALSLGPWPLAGLPLCLWLGRKNKNFIFCMLIFAGGFALTLVFSAFKNRYFLPYLLLLLPWLGMLLGRSGRFVRTLLVLSVSVSVLSFAPYVGQPLLVAFKNLDRHQWYSTKFPDYPAFQQLNNLPPGRILFVATPVYWLERDHVFSVYSETHVDYTRIADAAALKKRLSSLGITHVVLDEKVLRAMSQNPDPYYSGRRYCAKRCLELFAPLLQDRREHVEIQEDGLIVFSIHPWVKK